MSGLFITFEGPDGSGKSTQMQELAQFLRTEGIPHIVTREPGGTVISDKVRALLLDPDHREMVSETEVLLYAASRAQHVREKIVPTLEAGNVVLCDRFVDASIAYQGYGLGLDVEEVAKINRFATGGLTPDRSYLLDIPPEVGRERMEGRSGLDRIEQKQVHYHITVRDAFHKIYDHHRDRICLLNGQREKAALSADIKADFQRLWAQFQKESGV